MKTRWMILTTAAVAAGVFLYSHSLAAQANKAAEPGQTAPDFAIKDAYGKEFKLADFKGKVVVLEWINRDCPVSRGAHDKQQMQKTYKKYAAKGVVWLGIDSTEAAKPDANRVYAAEQGLAYPILHDADAKVANAYGAKRTPHMFVIDKEGKLAYAGAIDDKADRNHVAAALDELLAGKTVAKPKTDAYGCGIKNSKLAS
ncbi:MAG: redoxin domain-containing protein [Planctomycetes bacterium]|nr:redoxin domain-containing protein [Planctomycetota bacterium]